jgi:hypothetical protein
MELEIIILSKISQVLHVFRHVWDLWLREGCESESWTIKDVEEERRKGERDKRLQKGQI